MPASGFSAAGVFLNELFDRIGHVRATVEWLLHVVAHVVLSPHENVVNAGVPQQRVTKTTHDQYPIFLPEARTRHEYRQWTPRESKRTIAVNRSNVVTVFFSWPFRMHRRKLETGILENQSNKRTAPFLQDALKDA